MKKALTVLAPALCLIVFFAGVFDRDLWTPDEPRVAAISLEMSRNGDLIVPHLAGAPFVEKPPLYFAFAALFARYLGPLTGVTGALRLTSVLWGLGTVLFCYLTAWRMAGRGVALVSSLFLATMLGFVTNTHWIRVDIALAFFVTASVWSLAESYLAGRWWLCVACGFFTAGAFLVKGVLGPLLVFFPWVGLVLPWAMLRRRVAWPDRFLLTHAAGLAAFILLAGSWVLMLRQAGGNLWNEWFWDNHVGRLVGSEERLGHMDTGPFFYTSRLLLYTMPWFPLIGLWLVNLVKDFRAHRVNVSRDLMLLIWGLGSVVFLSLSATRRTLYLLPVLPPFAIMAATALPDVLPRWVRYLLNGWAIVCAVCAALFAATPVLLPSIAVSFSESISEEALRFLTGFTGRHLICALAALGCLVLAAGRALPAPGSCVAATALLYLAFFAVPGKALDIDKSMKAGMDEFIALVPHERRSRIAGWNIDETLRGGLYFYGDWAVPRIRNHQRLQNILSGKDTMFDSLLLATTGPPEAMVKGDFRVLLEGYPGSSQRRRPVFWIEGARP